MFSQFGVSGSAAPVVKMSAQLLTFPPTRTPPPPPHATTPLRQDCAELDKRAINNATRVIFFKVHHQ